MSPVPLYLRIHQSVHCVVSKLSRYHWNMFVYITVISHERHGVSDRRKIEYLLRNLFRPTSKVTPKLRIIVPLWREPTVKGTYRWSVGSPHKWPLIREAFPCHDVIITSIERHYSIYWTSSQTRNFVSGPYINPDSKVHGANMGPLWGRQDPGGPHVGPTNSAIWEVPPPRCWRAWAAVRHCYIYTIFNTLQPHLLTMLTYLNRF